MTHSNSQSHLSRPKSWLWLHKLGSPRYLYHLCDKWSVRCLWVALVLSLWASYWGLFVTPQDYQMGDSYRIMYIHVPSAWMSLFCYVVMAITSFIGLVWRIKAAHWVANSCAPIGAVFTFCALITGSLWGKPTWGTFWFWDARLTSELILLFLYLGYMALVSTIVDQEKAVKAGALLAIVGVINIPIIHFSVEWWNTLHQGASVSKLEAPSIHGDMLTHLFIMFAAVNFYFLATLFSLLQSQIIHFKNHTHWIKEIING